MGLRTGVGEMFAIGKIDGDYLGYVAADYHELPRSDVANQSFSLEDACKHSHEMVWCRKCTKAVGDRMCLRTGTAALATKKMTPIGTWATRMGVTSQAPVSSLLANNITKLATTEGCFGRHQRELGFPVVVSK